MGEDKKIDKFKQDAAYQKIGDKLENVVLLYEDKTYILFGNLAKKRKPKKA